jgi:putative membrane protein
MSVLTALYPWTKSLHIISMVAWMAGMLYLPRLFVYHCDTKPGSTDSERFKVMEYRLLKQIINPAMIATWLFGILLVLTPGVINWSAGWWHVKLVCVLLLTGLHGAMSKWRREFMEDRNTRSQRFYGDRCHGDRAPILIAQDWTAEAGWCAMERSFSDP